MEVTTLKFSSIIYLDAFRKFSRNKTYEVNFIALTLSGCCTPKELDFALSDFNASELYLVSPRPVGAKL